MLDDLKKILGATEIGRSKQLPGIKMVEGQQVLYISSTSTNEAGEVLFDKLGEVANKLIRAKYGGCVLAGCSIQVPAGSVFHALEYHGDMNGWRQDLLTAASHLGLLNAEIKESALHVSDGRIVLLKHCTVVFY